MEDGCKFSSNADIDSLYGDATNGYKGSRRLLEEIGG